jgi:hypothetical protein
MKVMAIGTIIHPLTPEQKQQVMSKEVPDTLKLYLDGTIEQFWFRQDPAHPGVVFLIQAESLDRARAAVETLPLVVEGFMKYELIQVGPLAPLGLLLQQ